MLKPKLYNYHKIPSLIAAYFIELNFALLPSAPALNDWKRHLLVCRGSTVGKGVKFGRNLWIDDFSKLEIGDYVFFNYGCMIVAAGGVSIGNNVLVGPGVTIISASHDTKAGKLMRTSPPLLGLVNIGSDAWLAAKCTVLPGVTIGEGAVVAAGAVVTRNVPPNTIVGGVPARVIRPRQ